MPKIVTYKKKVRKTAICPLCKESFVVITTRKYHPWCGDLVRNGELNRRRRENRQKLFRVL